MNPSFLSHSEHLNLFAQASSYFGSPEDRLEKVEHVIQVTDEMEKLRHSQDCLKFADFDRKVADFDSRLSRMEDSLLHCRFETQAEHLSEQLSQVDAVPALAQTLHSVKRVMQHDSRQSELRNNLMQKLDQLVETAREVAGQSRHADADLQNVRRELHRLQSHRKYTLMTVKNKLDFLVSFNSVDTVSLDSGDSLSLDSANFL